MYYLNDLLSEIMLESPMLHKSESDIASEYKMDILNHWVDLSHDFKTQIRLTPQDIAKEYKERHHEKMKLSKFSNSFMKINENFVDIVAPINATFHNRFSDIYKDITDHISEYDVYDKADDDLKLIKKLKELLLLPVESMDTITYIFVEFCRILRNIDKDCEGLINCFLRLLNYKLDTLEIELNYYNQNTYLSGGNYYGRILYTIQSINESKNLPVLISDLSALVYLFLKEIHALESGGIFFYKYFKQPVADIVLKRVEEMKNENIDLMDVLDMININSFPKPILNKNKLTENYDNSFISDEKLGEYLLFGPNIFRDLETDMSIYEIIHKAFSFTKEDVEGLFDIDTDSCEALFILSSDSKIFLKLTEDLQIMDILRKEDSGFLTLMKYKDINDIYLAYECHYKENIHNVRSVLGVSLLGKNENIIIPNDEERKYKFIYGKD